MRLMTASTKAQRGRIRNLKSAINILMRKKRRSLPEERKLCDNLRLAIRLYQDAVSAAPDIENKPLHQLAHKAMLYLGGEGDLRSVSLKDYDSERYGPYLGVSDEGSAADEIRRAALKSPKAIALGSRDPMVVGVALDAERLGGVGEVAVGPNEYVNVRLKCVNRILTSTNVGTRINLRFYRSHPVVVIKNRGGKGAIKQAQEGIRKAFEPFLKTPDKKPRKCTVLIQFDRRIRLNDAARILSLKKLVRYAERPNVSDKKFHQIGLKKFIRSYVQGKKDAKNAIHIATEAGVRYVVIDGNVRKQADRAISFPGLTNYLGAPQLNQVLDCAAARGVQVDPVNIVDPDTVARHIWSALLVARSMGCELGKYGLFPLTLKQMETVIKQIQTWFSDWTAAPVFFVDKVLVGAKQIYTRRNILHGLIEWLGMVAANKVPVVLIDTIDKATKIALLRTKTGRKGIINFENISALDQQARKKGIKVLWAGGITPPQVFELGRLGVFGIYVTSAAASPQPVPPEYESDPGLAVVKEATLEGVSRIKLLLEAGFLATRLRDRKAAEMIEHTAMSLLDALERWENAQKLKIRKREIMKIKKDIDEIEKDLAKHAIAGWKQLNITGSLR
jgi:hypothetical protein